MRLYEGMFVLDPTGVGKDAGAAEGIVKGLLDRREADVLLSERWAERKLAYEIRGKRKGIFVLTYFRVSGPAIRELSHDCELSEKVLRVLFLRREEEVVRRKLEARAEARAAKEAERAARAAETTAPAPKKEEAAAPVAAPPEPMPAPEASAEAGAPAAPEAPEPAAGAAIEPEAQAAAGAPAETEPEAEIGPERAGESAPGASAGAAVESPARREGDEDPAADEAERSRAEGG